MATVVAGALGECVHVAGVFNFLRLAEAAGWRTVFLGPAVSIEQIIEAAKREQADLVGVSYRLTPETGELLLGEFAEAADELRTAGVRFVFAGTSPVAERARTALEWLKLAYDTVGEDLHEAIHNQPGYYGIKVPPTLNHRYIFEDIPACIIHRTDYWRRGRTLGKLGAMILVWVN